MRYGIPPRDEQPRSEEQDHRHHGDGQPWLRAVLSPVREDQPDDDRDEHDSHEEEGGRLGGIESEEPAAPDEGLRERRREELRDGEGTALPRRRQAFAGIDGGQEPVDRLGLRSQPDQRDGDAGEPPTTTGRARFTSSGTRTPDRTAFTISPMAAKTTT